MQPVIDFGPRMFRALDNDLMDGDSGSFLDDEDIDSGSQIPDPRDWVAQDEPTATLVTSRLERDPIFGMTGDNWHMPVIDIDLPCYWVPSTAPGHGHLYINQTVSYDGLIEILEVLNKHGIVQDGYLRAAKSRGYSAVRVPGLKKPEA